MAAVLNIFRSWKKIRQSELIQFIARELKHDSGNSLRDLTAKAAKDSKEALELTKSLTASAQEAAAAAKVASEASRTALDLARKMDGRTRRIVGRQKRYEEKVDRIVQRIDELSLGHETLEEGQKKLEGRLDNQDEKFARFVVHEARNDLFKSTLAREEAKLLGQTLPELSEENTK